MLSWIDAGYAAITGLALVVEAPVTVSPTARRARLLATAVLLVVNAWALR